MHPGLAEGFVRREDNSQGALEGIRNPEPGNSVAGGGVEIEGRFSGTPSGYVRHKCLGCALDAVLHQLGLLAVRHQLCDLANIAAAREVQAVVHFCTGLVELREVVGLHIMQVEDLVSSVPGASPRRRREQDSRLRVDEQGGVEGGWVCVGQGEVVKDVAVDPGNVVGDLVDGGIILSAGECVLVLLDGNDALPTLGLGKSYGITTCTGKKVDYSGLFLRDMGHLPGDLAEIAKSG